VRSISPGWIFSPADKYCPPEFLSGQRALMRKISRSEDTALAPKVCKYKVNSSCIKDNSFSRLCLQDSCFGHWDHYLEKGLCKLADTLVFTIIIVYWIFAYTYTVHTYIALLYKFWGYNWTNCLMLWMSAVMYS
jgi:hypothetical protein